MTTLEEAQLLTKNRQREREKKRAKELEAAQLLTKNRQQAREKKRKQELVDAHALLAVRKPTMLADLEPVAPPRTPKILVIDIETAPLESYTWGIWEQNVGLEQIKVDWSILSYAAKWVGQHKAIYRDTGGRGVDKVRDDSVLLPEIWQLMDEAELIVAQNGVKFDIKKINYRLAEQNFAPYSPVRVIDTLLVSRRMFAATSHKLGWLSQKLTDTPKSKHHKFPGFELWLECLKDNPAAWAEMKKYNIQDIRATEKLYLKQRPWIPNHPNLGTYDLRAGGVCPKCSSPKLEPNGTAILQAGVYARYKCKSCGGHSRGKELMNTIEVRKSKMVNV